MSPLDWIVLVSTIGFIAIYGTWKARGSRNVDEYFRAGRSLGWATVGLSVMVAAVVAVLGLTTALILALTDVGVVAALGFGAYCAFWLGGGFGAIFGSAAVFGKEH